MPEVWAGRSPGIEIEMENNQWGPIPELVELLDHHPDELPDDDKTWRLAALRYGGLWGACFWDIWPDNLRPPAISRYMDALPKDGVQQQSSAKTQGHYPFSPVEGKVRRKDEIGDHNTLPELLERCHAWLGAQNLDGVRSWFTPWWRYCPYELVGVSQRGFAWVIAAYRLTINEKVQFPDISMYRLDEKATLGDCLAVHLCIERLLKEKGLQLGLDKKMKPEPERYWGGLRSQYFLAVYPYLGPRAEQLGISRWLKNFNRLIEASPLTQLIYPDLLEHLGEQAHFGHLTLIVPSGKEVGQAEQAEQAKQAEQVSQWGEMWLSQLARSVVGALISDPPALEKVRYCEERIRRLQEKAKQWWRPGRAKSDSNPEIVKAQKALEQAKAEYSGQYRQRLTMLPHLLGLKEDDQGSPFLSMRFFDMLIRLSVTQNQKAITEQLTKMLKSPWMPVSNLIFAPPAEFQQYFNALNDGERTSWGECGAGYEAVERTLFREGLRRDAEPKTLSAAEQMAIEKLLTPPLIGSPNNEPPAESSIREKAKQSGLTFEAAQRLMVTFNDIGICLSFSNPDLRGPSPRLILDSILATVINAGVPRSNAVAVEEDAGPGADNEP
ncbi:MAG TPA: hypothetical protein VHY08_12585 [Bacillota bacterium]|nr:hypothetical protein [Bacillota bacterium]